MAFGHPSTKGQLLVATPPLGDPHFDRSVVFMLEHHQDGAVGVVLNRPDEEVDDIDGLDGLEDWTALLSEPAIVFAGGPVERDALIAVAVAASPSTESWSPIDATMGTVDLTARPDDVAADIRALRIFRGYAGWSGGQLEGEIEVGAWMVLPAVTEDLFTAHPDRLWRDVLRRQGGRLAWIANAPDDLAAN